MKLIVMWLWGAAVIASWWVGVTTEIAPLIIIPLVGSLITAIAFGIYLYNNWNKEERKGFE